MLFLLALGVAVAAFFAARQLSAGTDDPMRAAAMAASRKFLTVVAVVALLASLTQLVRIIPAGHVGVIDLFGVVRPGESEVGHAPGESAGARHADGDPDAGAQGGRWRCRRRRG